MREELKKFIDESNYASFTEGSIAAVHSILEGFKKDKTEIHSKESIIVGLEFILNNLKTTGNF